MQTRVLRIDAAAPESAALAEAVAVLRRGGLVAFPSETVYGLGANALDSDAVGRIFAAKGRPANNPLIVHVATAEQARELTGDWPDTAARLSAQYWPGPLTLVLSRNYRVPEIVTAGGPTIAIRIPAHPVALALLCGVGLPLAAPSANRSSYLSPTRPEHVLRSLDGRIDLLLDAGPTTGGVESTVLDVSTSPPRLLRPGLIAPAQIEAVVGPIQRAALSDASQGGALPSPGMLSRHYAPNARLECTAKDAPARVEALCRGGTRVGWLAFGGSDLPQRPELTLVLMPSDAGNYAAQLYAALHILDEAEVEQIVVSMPPDTEEWLAVRDRLMRAASGTVWPRASGERGQRACPRSPEARS
jgi:L-threonylcarbamoyladenylate synthase